MSKFITAFIAAFALIGCQKPIDLGNQSFVGATRIGDILHATIDRDQIDFNLEGKISSKLVGTLSSLPTHNNYFYTLKDKPRMRIAILPDELIIYGKDDGRIKFGVALFNQRKSYSPVNIAGMYNFVSQYCSQSYDKFSYGTFELTADHLWHSWKMENGAQVQYSPTYSGSWVDKGNGLIQAFLGDRLFANLVLSEGAEDNLMVIDLVARNGIALGVKQKALATDSINASFKMLNSNKADLKEMTVKNSIVKLGKKHLTINYNQPWDGFIKDNRGEFLSLVSSKGTCFGLNIGTLTGRKFIFAALGS